MNYTLVPLTCNGANCRALPAAQQYLLPRYFSAQRTCTTCMNWSLISTWSSAAPAYRSIPWTPMYQFLSTWSAIYTCGARASTLVIVPRIQVKCSLNRSFPSLSIILGRMLPRTLKLKSCNCILFRHICLRPGLIRMIMWVLIMISWLIYILISEFAFEFVFGWPVKIRFIPHNAMGISTHLFVSTYQ